MSKKDMSKKERSKMGRLGTMTIYVHVAIMTLFFLRQATNNIAKFRAETIVQEETMEPRNETTMPALTLCIMPGYRDHRSLSGIMDFDEICPDVNDIKGCIEEQQFQREELIVYTMKYPPDYPGQLLDVSLTFQRSTFNLMAGSCFTFQYQLERTLSQSNMDILVMDMSPGNLFEGGKHVLTAAVHQRDRFIPSLGISQELMGQQTFYFNIRPYGVPLLSMEVKHRVRMNTGNHQCNEDPEYNIIQCMEEFVASKVGCASPWDLYTTNMTVCTTKEQFTELFKQHSFIFTAGAPQFIQETGCLPPCEYDEYFIEEREGVASVFADIMSTTGVDAAGFLIGVKDSNLVVSRDTLLYGINSLVGNIGGCLGMFLGASFISLYQYTLTAADRGSKIV